MAWLDLYHGLLVSMPQVCSIYTTSVGAASADRTLLRPTNPLILAPAHRLDIWEGLPKRLAEVTGFTLTGDVMNALQNLCLTASTGQHQCGGSTKKVQMQNTVTESERVKLMEIARKLSRNKQ